MDSFFAKEGIALDVANIQYNEGIRTTAKFLLNSFWGKFAQTPNKTKTAILETDAQVVELFHSSTKEVVGFVERHGDDGFLEVQYVERDYLYKESGDTNTYIAGCTTAQARLKLWGTLDSLGDRALYGDTDSVIYRATQGEETPELGQFISST